MFSYYDEEGGRDERKWRDKLSGFMKGVAEWRSCRMKEQEPQGKPSPYRTTTRKDSDGTTPGVATGVVKAGSGFTEPCVTLLLLPGHLGLTSLTDQERSLH